MDLDSFSLETTYVDVKLDFSSTVGKMSYGLLRFIYPIKKFYWCWSVLTKDCHYYFDPGRKLPYKQLLSGL